MNAALLYQDPNALAGSYSAFRVSERLLLTGHSHQAWPDCAREGQLQAWEDAARLVDLKWDQAVQQANAVRAGFSELLGVPPGQLALGANTHELVIRFLSGLPLEHRKQIITTEGEFHTIRRQLDRLAEGNLLEIIKVPAAKPDEIAGHIVGVVSDATAAVLVSAVLFRSAAIVPHLDRIMHACATHGAELLVDAYHAINVIPFDLPSLGLEEAFVTGGGYKYCQLGEGNCFLRIPPGCTMRPIVTGWFSEFGALAEPPGDALVPYGSGPDRFAGATYDPTSHYRAVSVFDFFRRHELTPDFLREVSLHQMDTLRAAFDGLDLDPRVIRRDRTRDRLETAGFLALSTSKAAVIQNKLRSAGVLVDYRDDILRLGPAPYLSDSRLTDAVGILGEIANSL